MLLFITGTVASQQPQLIGGPLPPTGTSSENSNFQPDNKNRPAENSLGESFQSVTTIPGK